MVPPIRVLQVPGQHLQQVLEASFSTCLQQSPADSKQGLLQGPVCAVGSSILQKAECGTLSIPLCYSCQHLQVPAKIFILVRRGYDLLLQRPLQGLPSSGPT